MTYIFILKGTLYLNCLVFVTKLLIFLDYVFEFRISFLSQNISKHFESYLS